MSLVERSIRTIKERTRCQIQYLPYSKYRRNMIIGCVIFVIMNLNNEVGMSKLSTQYSPSTLVTGKPQPTYQDVTTLAFREYAEVYAANNVINNNEEQFISAISLYPSGNSQNRWIFMSLNTGRFLHRQQWKKLPVSQDIIKRVEELGNTENQTYI